MLITNSLIKTKVTHQPPLQNISKQKKNIEKFDEVYSSNKNIINPGIFIIPAKNKLSFSGIEVKKFSEIPSLNDERISELANRINESGKTPTLISDYDGTFTDHSQYLSAKPKAHPYAGTDNFLQMQENAAKKDIPFVILTTRAFHEVEGPIVLGDAVNNMNIASLNGNQFRLNLTDNKKTQDFIKNWQEKEDYETRVKKTKDNKLKVEVDPIFLPGFKKIDKEFKEKLEPLGFDLNNAGLFLYLKWMKLKGLTEERGNYEVNVKDSLLKEVKKDIKLEDSTNSPKVTIKSDKEELAVPLNNLIKYGVNKFEKIVQKNVGDQIGEKVILKDHSPKMYYEVADIRGKTNNKGVAVGYLTDLFGGFPVFMGDKAAPNNDDGYGIKKAIELGGTGIGVLKSSSKDSIEERNQIKTQAEYKLDSYAETLPFVNKLIDRIGA